jgi:molybdopterin-guanine dinucleotide biosynthesis protein A
VGGRPILARILAALGPLADEWLALVDDATLPDFGRLRLVVDPQPHAGVLPALVHGLRAASGEVCLLVASDMPFVARAAFDYLLTVQCQERAAVVVPHVDGHLQPMHAVVDRQVVLAALESALVAGEQQLFKVLQSLRPRLVEAAELRRIDPELRSLFNVNTPADLALAETLALAN